MEELNFKGNDPGAVRFGNFINYYDFHDPVKRIENLDNKIFPKFKESKLFCLDIGCNSGELTLELYKYMQSQYTDKEIFILGIDLDPVLIQRANEKNENDHIHYVHVDVMDFCERYKIKSYLTEHSRKVFEFTFCFSVIMWIHLNHGDEGLNEFLNFAADHTKIIIIEIQPWKCYKTAQRRLRRSKATFPQFQKISIKENVEKHIENHLLSYSFSKINETFSPAWKRKIFSFSCSLK